MSNDGSNNIWNGIHLDSVSACSIDDVSIVPGDSAEFGVRWSSDGDILWINRVTVRPNNTSSTVDGFLFEGGVTTIVASASGTGLCNNGWRFIDSGGFSPSLISLSRCVGEDSNTNGFLFENADGVDMTDTYANINDGCGVSIGAFAQNLRINGGQFNYNGDEGILCDDSQEIHIQNAVVQGNGSNNPGNISGINFVGCLNFSVIGGREGGEPINGTATNSDQSYGVEISDGGGTADWYRVVAIDGHGNVNGNVLDNGTGANKYIDPNNL
jgi:hypothetical protein